ncbi:MAG: hypothetical protein SOZ07_08935 [Prevotella sp.]|nr:hypothetical protein [Prevotella sp.]
MTVIFFISDRGVFGSGATAPQKLEKNHEASQKGDPCGTPLALTLQRKMNVGLLENEKNAMDDWKWKVHERMLTKTQKAASPSGIKRTHGVWKEENDTTDKKP